MDGKVLLTEGIEDPQLPGRLIKHIEYGICSKISNTFLFLFSQGSHRLEKYLYLEGLFENALKIKSALKSTGKSLVGLEKSLNSTIFCMTQHC